MHYHIKHRVLRKGGFSFEKVPLFQINCFPATYTLICPKSFGNQKGKRDPTKGSSQECIKANLVPTAAVTFTALCETGVQRKYEQLLFIFE